MARARTIGKKRAPSGRVSVSRAQLREDAQRTAVEARQRVYGIVDETKAKDPLVGTVIGRLLFAKQISSVQYDAAHIYAERRRTELARAIDQNPNPQSPGFANVSRGISCAPDEDPELTARRHRQHEDMMTFLEDLGRHHTTNLKLVDLLDRAIVRDQEIAWSPQNLGALRAGLNEIARLCRMGG